MESSGFAATQAKGEENDISFSQSSYLEHRPTVGGHADNGSQQPLPGVSRSFASPAPLGLISFATGIALLAPPPPPLTRD